MMTSNNLEKIESLLGKLHGYAYFRPEEGPLKERLSQAVLDALEGEAAEMLAENPFDLELSIGRQEGEIDLSVSFSVDHPDVTYMSQMAVHLLTDEELEDLARYLQPAAESPAAEEAAVSGKTIVRKKLEDSEYHEIGPASARLKVSPEWLKSVVPCTDYSYEEIDGRKYIREYYWSKELIERLFKIKCSKTTPEDLQYVATECCHGDTDWARDLIARVKSPNRPEPGQREQSQKGQGRGPQAKSAQPKAPQGRPAPNKPASPAAGPAAQAQGKAATEKPAGAPPQGAGPAAGNRERTRSRSRHRKPFRQQGKDAPRKPEQAGEQKQPQ